MSPEIVKYILPFFVVLIGSFLGSYIRRKGENLATKEDISEITKIIESIKTNNAFKIEDYSHHNRLRMAALDKRLDIYQQAFTLWLNLRRSVYNREKNIKMVMKCQEWWETNCLYLDDDSRKAFLSSIHAVALHPDLTGGQATQEELKENWKYIKECGEILTRGAGLPTFSENELDDIDKTDKITTEKANSSPQVDS